MAHSGARDWSTGDHSKDVRNAAHLILVKESIQWKILSGLLCMLCYAQNCKYLFLPGNALISSASQLIANELCDTLLARSSASALTDTSSSG